MLHNNVYRSYFHPFLDIWAPTISFYYLRDIAQHRRLCLVWLCAFICKVMLNIPIIVPNSTIRIIWKGKWIKYHNGIEGSPSTYSLYIYANNFGNISVESFSNVFEESEFDKDRIKFDKDTGKPSSSQDSSKLWTYF